MMRTLAWSNLWKHGNRHLQLEISIYNHLLIIHKLLSVTRSSSQSSTPHTPPHQELIYEVHHIHHFIKNSYMRSTTYTILSRTHIWGQPHTPSYQELIYEVNHPIKNSYMRSTTPIKNSQNKAALVFHSWRNWYI